MKYYVVDTRFPHLPHLEIEAKNETMAKIAYCRIKGLNPLLNSEKLDVWEFNPDNIIF